VNFPPSPSVTHSARFDLCPVEAIPPQTMKKLHLWLGLAVLLGGKLSFGQTDAFDPSGQPATVIAPFSEEQLDQLLGPIALYPDALIALILPASTASSDIVLAARYLASGSNPADADNQPWDDSVRALAHYPDVVKWMDDNLAWTKQLGDVFALQPADVMNTVQRLRARARAAGTLVDTPQQQVVVAQNTIEIVPTQPDVIYVPYYDPGVVFAPQPSYYYGSSLFSFSPGYATGFWLSYSVDWRQRQVCYVDRPHREIVWRERRDSWHQPLPVTRPSYVTTFRPQPQTQRRGYSRPSQFSTAPTQSTSTQSRVVQPGTSAGRAWTNEPRRDDRNDGRASHGGPNTQQNVALERPVTVTNGRFRNSPPASVSTPQPAFANPAPPTTTVAPPTNPFQGRTSPVSADRGRHYQSPAPQSPVVTPAPTVTHGVHNFPAPAYVPQAAAPAIASRSSVTNAPQPAAPANVPPPARTDNDNNGGRGRDLILYIN
jgi:hypothetical protein